MFGISKLEAYGIVFVVLSLLMAGAYFKGHHNGYVEGRAEVQAEFDKFKNETKAIGLKAQQDNIDKEKTYANNIADARSVRDDALNRLQLAQAAISAGRRASAGNPSAPAGSRQVCIDSAAYNAAFEQFGKRLDGFIQDARAAATAGDSAQIDAAALIKAWPRSP